MAENDAIIESISRLKGISPEAAEELWALYFPRLLHVARARLGHMPRRSFDEEDLALSALHSFFRGREEGRFRTDGDHGDLWPLLVTLLARKISTEKKRSLADKRGGGSVRGESVFAVSDSSGEICRDGLAQVIDERQLPQTCESLARTCEELLARLPDEKHRQTALLRMEGYTNAEISGRLECSLARTKQRLALIREIWAQETH